MRARMVALTWVAAVALVIATAMPAPAQTLAGAELLAALRAGGYVIYFRHADTDHSRQDQRPVNFDDCATQRALSDKGRQNSCTIGEAIRALDIPIGAAAIIRRHGTSFEEVARLDLEEWRELGGVPR